MKVSKLWWTAAAMLLVSCSGEPSTLTAAVAQFMDRDPGFEPYRTRMLATADYLRIDDGGAGRDFILFARRQRTIYNVNSGDKLVLIIRAPQSAPEGPPLPLRHEVVTEKDTPPGVGGKPVIHYRLLTNGRLCHDLYAAPGLLPEMTAAMREFIEVLARDQASRLAGAPKEMLTPCWLANNVFAATRYLDYGLPVRRVDHDGRVSELVDYRSDFAADQGLFQLPADYRQMEITELRGKQ